MNSEPSTAVPLPGLEDYHFVPVQLDQRDRPVYDNEGYHQWGSFCLDGRQAPVKVLLLFDSLTGPLRLNLPALEKDAFQLGELAARVIWLTISRPGLDKVSFFIRSAMPAKLAQVLLLKDESAALPWPPPNRFYKSGAARCSICWFPPHCFLASASAPRSTSGCAISCPYILSS